MKIDLEVDLELWRWIQVGRSLQNGSPATFAELVIDMERMVDALATKAAMDRDPS